MFTEADRIRAIELYFKYGRKITAVIRELGYPTELNLRRWVRAWEASGGDISCLPRKERYSDVQKHAAVDHYLTHGCCLAYTRRALGYPCSALLIRWLDELHPGKRRIFTGTQNPDAPFRPEVKRQAVRELCTRSDSARNTAQDAGVSRQVLYKWKDEVIGDEAYSAMRKRSVPRADEDIDALRSERDKLLQEIRQLQMEHDILRKADEIIKKGPGISASALTNREKTKVADALREAYPLPALLSLLHLARSSYFYHRATRRAGDKYAGIRIALAEIFHGNYCCYGYPTVFQRLLRHYAGYNACPASRQNASPAMIVAHATRSWRG